MAGAPSTTRANSLPRSRRRTVRLGRLPVGYYEVRRGSRSDGKAYFPWVLAPLAVPTPKTSPIGIDVAMACPSRRTRCPPWPIFAPWQASTGSRPAELGRNGAATGRVRIPHPLRHVSRTQHAAGLQILQVNQFVPLGGPGSRAVSHGSPRRLPFLPCDGPAVAHDSLGFEPWNEADIPMFGGHIGSEIAALQKASYLGLKAGNPKSSLPERLCRPCPAHPCRLPRQPGLPYFDIFDLHHYAA